MLNAISVVAEKCSGVIRVKCGLILVAFHMERAGAHKMKLTFTEKEFDVLRNFQNRLTKEFGVNTYVGTDNVNLFVEYSPELKAMIRPLPGEKHFEFEIKHLSCRDCKKKALLLCLPSQEDFVCVECLVKRKKVKEVKAE